MTALTPPPAPRPTDNDLFRYLLDPLARGLPITAFGHQRDVDALLLARSNAEIPPQAFALKRIVNDLPGHMMCQYPAETPDRPLTIDDDSALPVLTISQSLPTGVVLDVLRSVGRACNW